MSIKSAREEIRAARRLVQTSPTSWEILSSGGAYKHHLVYEEGRQDVVCLTCEAKWSHNRGWCRKRVLDWLERKAKEKV